MRTGSSTADTPRARTVVVIHPDGHSREDSRRRFVAEVLQANGFAVLSLVLPDVMPWRTSAIGRERALRGAARQIEVATGPAGRVALLAWEHADLACLELARHAPDETLAAVVFVAPRPGLVLRRTDVPALIVNGARTVGHAPLPSPHERAVLPGSGPTLDENGAHEAIARTTLEWLRRRMLSAGADLRTPPLASPHLAIDRVERRGGEAPFFAPVARCS